MSIWSAIKDANRAIDPEPSVALRVAVGATVMVAVVALLAEDIVGTAPAAAALVGVPAGFALSYAQRFSDALILKGFLAIGLVAALVAFVGDLAAAAQAGFANVQVPLAELFVWVQVLHSLHVPARRDLMFSLASSGAMLSITAALSVSPLLGIWMALWAVGLVLSLTLAYRSQLTDVPALESNPAALTAGVTGSVARLVSMVVIVGMILFFVLPAARSSRAFTFPMNLPSSIPLPNPGGFSNPSLGNGGQSGTGSDASNRAAFGYFGFAEQLDTGLRGRPNDQLVMRVRAPAPAFWRGQTFDTWDGRTWTLSDDDASVVGGNAPITTRPTLGDDRPFGEEFIQTFYLEAVGPNVVFGAYRITDVYFPERFLFQLTDGTLRSGVELGSETVYTVVSHRPHVTETALRSADPLVHGVPDDIADRYLQLPDVPDNVVELARTVTASAPTTYDKVRALEAWMAANTTYSLDIPPLPPGADAVEHYLFETQQGFCEQIGSSLVVMLRSQGIPARLVVGYVPGDRNPFTGLFEVKASDAHSWAEVWFPGIGWQGFDPTAAVPLSGDAEPPTTAGAGVLDYLSTRLPRIASTLAWGLRVGLVGGVALVLVSIAGRLFEQRRRRRDQSWDEAMTELLGHAGLVRGRPRDAAETTVEFVDALVAGPIPDDRLVGVAAAIDDAAFGADDLPPERRQEIEETLDAILTAHPPSPLRSRAR